MEEIKEDYCHNRDNGHCDCVTKCLLNTLAKKPEPKEEMIPLSEAMEFSKWSQTEGWKWIPHWKEWIKDGETTKTDSELYELFKNREEKE